MVKKTDGNDTSSENDKKLLGNLLDDCLEDDRGMGQGLINLNSIPPFKGDPGPKPVNGKVFVKGVMGFKRRGQGELRLAVACGKAQVRYIPLAKYIAMVEKMHDPESATIMIQNFKDQEEYQSSRGQVLARINGPSSAITFIQGVTGRIIRGPRDIALFDVYHIDRTDLMSFYVASKAQISNGETLEAMIQAYDGWKAFDVPLDPLYPYGQNNE